MTREAFYAACAAQNLMLSQRQKEQLQEYYRLLVETNCVMNLTAITEEEEVYEKHFFDSLSFSFGLDLKDQKLADIGTGAGFPGLVLAVCYPNLHVTLVDALAKRCRFLEETADRLGVQNVTVVHARGEEFVLECRESFDFAVARAVARLNILLEIIVPCVKTDGMMIAMKGPQGKEELEEAKRAMELLSCRLKKAQEYRLPSHGDERINLLIQKKKKTDLHYPRPFAQIKKKPL